MTRQLFKNPFRPGAGHDPPFLAGRTQETAEFEKLLEQTVILENLVLTGLRGVGKTVLLNVFRPLAINAGWAWVGSDLSESTSVSEETIAIRLLTDLSVATSNIVVTTQEVRSVGFVVPSETKEVKLDYSTLLELFQRQPGLVADKLRAVLEFVWMHMKTDSEFKGLIFAYDEAQNMADHARKEQYPLSLLLDVFQSIQRKNIPFMLALTGLPTLFPKLVQARTFAERMFRVVFLNRLNDADSREAIEKPIKKAGCPVTLDPESIDTIASESGGYPYFIQFICREAYDAFAQGKNSVPINEITRKLDTDFFAGRWARATDRQRDLMRVIASLDNCDSEFTTREVVVRSKEMLDKKLLEKGFGSSHTNQMLVSLGNEGLVYKNRHGKYSFAVPMLSKFIRRQE